LKRNPFFATSFLGEPLRPQLCRATPNAFHFFSVLRGDLSVISARAWSGDPLGEFFLFRSHGLPLIKCSFSARNMSGPLGVDLQPGSL
jgi:hypothetical protein